MVGLVPALAFCLAPALAGQEEIAPPMPSPPGAVAWNALLEGGSRSYLGVGVREVDSDIAREKKLAEERGVVITSVAEGSPAEKGGLKRGDVVLEYNGQVVHGVEQFIRLVRETPVGRPVTLKVNRDGSVLTVNATIGTCKNCGPLGRITIPDIQVWSFPHDLPSVYTTWRSGMLGIEAEALASQLAEYFGVQEGVLIRSVKPDSPAAKAGLRAGDVIIKAGDKRVGKPREVTEAIRSAKGGPLVFTIVRDKREMTVTVTAEEAGPRREGLRYERIRRQGVNL
jgi:serine protease Do